MSTRLAIIIVAMIAATAFVLVSHLPPVEEVNWGESSTTFPPSSLIPPQTTIR